jgi:hypothetical protein
MRTAGTLKAWGLMLAWGILTSSAWAEDRAPVAKENQGYYLLHKLSDDESQLDLILIAKDTTPEVASYLKRVSKTAVETLEALDQLKAHDKALDWDKNPLPEFERDVRGAIHDEKQHQLLFGTKGAEFARAILVSQIEATTYALNIAKVLADQETNAHRVKILRHLSEQWQTRQHEAYQLLRE